MKKWTDDELTSLALAAIEQLTSAGAKKLTYPQILQQMNLGVESEDQVKKGQLPPILVMLVLQNKVTRQDGPQITFELVPPPDPGGPVVSGTLEEPPKWARRKAWRLDQARKLLISKGKEDVAKTKHGADFDTSFDSLVQMVISNKSDYYKRMRNLEDALKETGWLNLFEAAYNVCFLLRYCYLNKPDEIPGGFAGYAHIRNLEIVGLVEEGVGKIKEYEGKLDPLVPHDKKRKKGKNRMETPTENPKPGPDPTPRRMVEAGEGGGTSTKEAAAAAFSSWPKDNEGATSAPPKETPAADELETLKARVTTFELVCEKFAKFFPKAGPLTDEELVTCIRDQLMEELGKQQDNLDKKSADLNTADETIQMLCEEAQLSAQAFKTALEAKEGEVETLEKKLIVQATANQNALKAETKKLTSAKRRLKVTRRLSMAAVIIALIGGAFGMDRFKVRPLRTALRAARAANAVAVESEEMEETQTEESTETSTEEQGEE